MDRFELLVSNRKACAIYAPGTIAKAFHNNPVIKREFGDDYPVMFIPLDRDPPEMKIREWVFREEHFGAHAFLSWAAIGDGAQLAGVAAFCMLDGASRAGAEHLLESGRDAYGELGGIHSQFHVMAARVPNGSRILKSGHVLQVNLPKMVAAYTLYRATPKGDLHVIRDRRCPLCHEAETRGISR